MIKVAAAHGALNYLDLTGALSRMRTIPEGATDYGCQLIAFPEVYVAGDPDLVWLERSCIGQKLFPVLYRNTVRIPGPAIRELSRMAGSVRRLGARTWTRA
jgi:nitrilase